MHTKTICSFVFCDILTINFFLFISIYCVIWFQRNMCANMVPSVRMITSLDMNLKVEANDKIHEHCHCLQSTCNTKWFHFSKVFFLSFFNVKKLYWWIRKKKRNYKQTFSFCRLIWRVQSKLISLLYIYLSDQNECRHNV